jgi:CLASP N terminal
MYMTPNSGGGGSPHDHPHGGAPAISDAPIARFAELIEETHVSEWQKRTAALQRLVDMIPEGSAYYDSSGLAWYNSPPTLRRLASPVSELLKDARSTVVKRTCLALSQLYTRCQSEARYLFKDLMPTVLAVHAQTVQVIRQAVQSMVLEAIAEVPCKMVMPLWMERLKVDKSRTVRDACSIYLGQALQCWSHEEGYLTDEIWLQVGKTLISTLRDPSPSVRSNSKLALERIRRQQEENGESTVWDKLVNDPDGPAARDRKLQQWLKTLGTTDNSPDAEELSVASRFSYNSDIRIRTKTSFSPSNININNNNANKSNRPSRVDEDCSHGGGGGGVPLSIAVAANDGSGISSSAATANGGLFKRTTTGGGLGPPLRRVTASAPAAAPAAMAHSSPPRISDTKSSAAAKTRPPPPPASSSSSPSTTNSHVIPAVSESLSDLEQILTLKPSPSAAAAKKATATAPAPSDSALQQIAAERVSEKFLRYDDYDFDDDNLKIKKHPISDLTATVETVQKEENHASIITPELDNLLQLEEASSFPADLNLPALRQTFARTATSTKNSSSPSPKVEDDVSNDSNIKLSMATAVSEESLLTNPSGESHATNEEMRSVSSTQAVITVDKGTSNNIVQSSTNSSTEEGPFVANMQELKKYSKRRTRSSLLIQERLRVSTSMTMLLEEDEAHKTTAAAITRTTTTTGEPSDEENATPNPVAGVLGGKPPVFPTPKQPLSSSLPSHPEVALSPTDQSDGGGAIVSQAPEHMVIAIRLLKAHKEHVDAIMETLRIEMETLRDFDQLLEEPGRPTEEEVLDYFESVGICLEQRTLAGSQLQREMDLVSRGEPPQD